MKEYAVLLVGGDSSSRVAEELREDRDPGYRIVHVGQLGPAIEALREQEFDLVLTESRLEDLPGAETALRLRKHAPEVPCVVLLGGEDRSEWAAWIRQGAQDCLAPDEATGALLRHAIQFAVERHLVVRELETTCQIEHVLADRDSLTRLPHRRIFMDRLEHALARAQRDQRTIAVFSIDLDHFKTINETHGHRVGDRLLQLVAERLKSSTREPDTVSRMGGDEFVVLLEDIRDPGAAALVAQKILATISSPIELEGRELELSASIGVSLFPRQDATVTSLIDAADFAMYDAKNSGGGTFCFEKSGVIQFNTAQSCSVAELRTITHGYVGGVA